MRFQIMDYTGHSTLEFNLAEEGMLKAAADKFAELIGDGKVAATRQGDGQLTHTRSFDPNADETVFHAPMQGG
jgi:hypothetical protein